MWKCLTRGLKTFEQNVYRVSTVPTTKVTQDSKQSTKCILLKLSPVVTEHISRFYGFYKSCSCGENRKEKRRREYRAREGSCLNDVRYEWFEALQWSSVLMLGWYLCLPFHHKRVYLKSQKEPGPRRPLAKYSTHDCSRRLFEYLTRLVIAKPVNYVLPQVTAVKSSQSATSQTSSKGEVLENESHSLEGAHNKVLGALSNWLGTESMRKGNHTEAVLYFHDAVKREHPAAVFNLGICYEMGLGTSQDFTLAAQLYKKASDLGHATAMYNLGVFHVHGWGSVDVNVNEAKKLFKQAADLGQKDAKQALALDPSSKENERSDTSHTKIRDSGVVVVSDNPASFYEDPKMTDATDHWYQLLNIKLDDFPTPRKTRMISTDSGVVDMSPEAEDSLPALY